MNVFKNKSNISLLVIIGLLVVVIIVLGVNNYRLAKIQVIKEKTIENTDSNVSIKGLSFLSTESREVTEKYKFVENQNYLYLGPYQSSPRINIIEGNTLVKVIEEMYVNNVPWLQVEMPVYDTPMDNIGWIKESATQKYSNSVKSKILRGIQFGMREGAKVYETKTGKFSDINDSNAVILDRPILCIIIERMNGYAKVETGSGYGTFWVKESDIVFP